MNKRNAIILNEFISLTNFFQWNVSSFRILLIFLWVTLTRFSLLVNQWLLMFSKYFPYFFDRSLRVNCVLQHSFRSQINPESSQFNVSLKPSLCEIQTIDFLQSFFEDQVRRWPKRKFQGKAQRIRMIEIFLLTIETITQEKNRTCVGQIPTGIHSEGCGNWGPFLRNISKHWSWETQSTCYHKTIKSKDFVRNVSSSFKSEKFVGI
jgi:hypothetical protein